MENGVSDILIYIIVTIGIIVFNIVKTVKKAQKTASVAGQFADDDQFNDEDAYQYATSAFSTLNISEDLPARPVEKIKPKISNKENKTAEKSSVVNLKKTSLTNKNDNRINLRQAVIYTEILNLPYKNY